MTTQTHTHAIKPYRGTVRLEPARTIVQRFGGIRKTAKAAGVHYSRVSKWMKPAEVGGTGGLIPQKHHRRLLAAARECGVPLTPGDIMGVADESEAA